jgi:hypothetical protein
MTEQARGSGPPAKGPYDPDAIRERVAQAAMTEQARETPEPLTPATDAGKALFAQHRVWGHPSYSKADERHDAKLLADIIAIEREAALRAATPDPDEPTGFRPGMSYGNGGNVLSDRAASAAEPGLRRAVAEVITALDAWGTADGLIGARAYADSLRAALSGTTEQQP